MPSLSDWKVPSNEQPRPADYAFDLEVAMAAVVGLRATIPEDAFTAQMLGTERAGNGAFFRCIGRRRDRSWRARGVRLATKHARTT